MANKEIHDLITSEELSSSDVFAEQRENEGLWLTRKLTFNALGLFLNNVLGYASHLTKTTAKTIIGAINEIAYKEVDDTLTAGSTSLVLTDDAITASSTIDVYVDVAFYGVVPTNLVVNETNHTITLTFEAQLTDMPVKVRVS